MKQTQTRQDYQLLDSGGFEKLEQIGPVRLARPSPQAVWGKRLSAKEWGQVDARFVRSSGGDGKWTILNKNMPKSWTVQIGDVTFTSSLTDFGHVGIFAEQRPNWEKMGQIIRDRCKIQKDPVQILNLFAYTGGSTLAAVAAGAHVVHLDASKTSVAWARENAVASKLDKLPVRWITDDVQTFVQRELRRGSRYHGIILDPPSFGRGTKGEAWKIEEHLLPLVANLNQLLATEPLFVLLSAHSPGYSPLVLKNLLLSMQRNHKDVFVPEEMVLPASAQVLPLPSGASCFLLFG